MGLGLAIKRSYRYFIPPSLLAPRKLGRRLYEPMFMYLVGLVTGMYTYARPGEGNHITKLFAVALLVLLVFKWWSGASADDRSAKA
jgi:hypothetical protein